VDRSILVRTRHLSSLLAVGLIATLVVPAVASAQSEPEVPLTVPQVRDSDPVVLTGAQFPQWAAPADLTLATPSIAGLQCLGEENGVPSSFLGDTPLTSSDPCTHSSNDDPLVSSQDLLQAEGVPVDRLLGYRWNGQEFVQIPFQVDEMYTRYLSNNASGFSFYSGRDRHDSYVFDREGWLWTEQDPDNACLAAPRAEVAPDPVPGLDTDDELVFMARDAGARAPSDATRPAGIDDMAEVAVTDPVTGDVSFAYVALAADDGPAAAFDATNGYVRYERDADADIFLFSESSYRDYGNAPHGAWFNPATGECVDDPAQFRQRRPGDQATITTPRYSFRYDGRWLMTDLRVSGDPGGDWTYGEDLVDQWKARAFQQRPGGTTPCCGFEEEVNNWGGSSILLGEKAGPVRVIRETWGADSATNLIRREVFYRDEIRMEYFLRVHVIPPIDGIYAQWDHRAMAIDTYYNPFVPEGVPVDGVNDEAFGNSYIGLSESGFEYDGNDHLTDLVKEFTDGTPIKVGDPDESCEFECVRNDIDSPDPTFSGVNALLTWEQVDGPTGTIVSRWSSSDVTPGGAAHALVAVPYYRDDACFDDGTGTDPGPHLNPRRTDDGQFAWYVDRDGVERPRECWDIERHRAAVDDPDDDYDTYLGTDRFFQGSIGTHGMHLLLIADSDNLHLPLPVTEIIAEQRMVLLPPQGKNVGEAYGRGFEFPLVALALPTTFGPASTDPGPGDPDERDATTLTWDGATTHRSQGTTELAAILTRDDGTAVEDVVITFEVDGQTHDATTDATGRAAVDVTLTNGVDHQVTAVFAGDDDHVGSTATVVVTWSPGPPAGGPPGRGQGAVGGSAASGAGTSGAMAPAAVPAWPTEAPVRLLAVALWAIAATALVRVHARQRA
jgi:hypothetical protein